MKTNWPLLAFCRFALALIVVACHLTNITIDNPVINAAAQFSGFAAVAGFLLISGFSISNSIHRKPQGYMSRRVDRIWPCYLASLVFSMAVIAVAGGAIEWPRGGLVEAPTLTEFLGNACMMQGILVKPIAINAVVWTLAVEELMYLFAPILLRVPRRAAWLFIGASWLFCAVAPRLGLPYYSDSIGLWGVGSLAWLWLLGWQLQTGDSERTRTAMLLLSCAGISLSPWGNTLAVVTVGATAAILIHSESIKLPERANGVLQWAGNVSYPLYLMHYPTLLLIAHFTGSLVAWHYIAAVLLVSAAVHHGIELPFRAYRLRQQERVSMSKSTNGVSVSLEVLSDLIERGNLGRA